MINNNEDHGHHADHDDITAELKQLDESINFLSSSANNFKQDERLVVVGIPHTKDNQRAQSQLLGKLFLSLQY